MPEWNPRANDIFVRAAEIDAPADRQLFVAQQCDGDPALRAQVESLLAAGGQIGSFLQLPAVAPPPGADATGAYQPLTEGPGTVIGPYKLLQHIGEGGFGAVYMAEQEHPVRRKVALKIIKPGMDTREVIARFESERQALAMMDHPNIARVFDAGATDSGRPYFVMELVRGVPITEFCDRNKLPAEGRLRLFVTVCQAIQHAHHKGVIHRDIKPSNVMVTLHDGVPVVKVIDFGVAKATAQKLTERTLFTAYGQMVGTPLYMSPEQAEMSGLDIDTRSDIFSLGVLLYELLTGTTPLDSKELRKAGYAEMQRLIREEEAPRPSTRFSSLGGEATVLATNRGTDVRRLSQLLRSDLDWIVMKSLEKDRNRRYGSPANFAADVERFLAEQPVEARPPSAWYRFRKAARRNKVALTTAAVVAAALIVGTAVSAWQAVAAGRAEAAAVAERDEKEKARLAEEEQRAAAVTAAGDARRSEAAAKASELRALAGERKAKDALEEAERTLVDSLLRPVGQGGGPPGALELAALEKLAGLSDDAVRVRFLSTGLDDPECARRLGLRAEPVARAVVGLDRRRKRAAEGLLLERLRRPGQPRDTVLACLALTAALRCEDEHLADLGTRRLLELANRPTFVVREVAVAGGQVQQAVTFVDLADLRQVLAAADGLTGGLSPARAGAHAEAVLAAINEKSDEKRARDPATDASDEANLDHLVTLLQGVLRRLPPDRAAGHASAAVTTLLRTSRRAVVSRSVVGDGRGVERVDYAPRARMVAGLAPWIRGEPAEAQTRAVLAEMRTAAGPDGRVVLANKLHAVRWLANALRALLPALPGDRAGRHAADAAALLLAARDREAAGSPASDLADGARDLAPYLPADTAALLADALGERLTKATDTGEVLALGGALHAVLGRLPADQAGDRADKAAESLVTALAAAVEKPAPAAPERPFGAPVRRPGLDPAREPDPVVQLATQLNHLLRRLPQEKAGEHATRAAKVLIPAFLEPPGADGRPGAPGEVPPLLQAIRTVGEQLPAREAQRHVEPWLTKAPARPSRSGPLLIAALAERLPTDTLLAALDAPPGPAETRAQVAAALQRRAETMSGEAADQLFGQLLAPRRAPGKFPSVQERAGPGDVRGGVLKVLAGRVSAEQVPGYADRLIERIAATPSRQELLVLVETLDALLGRLPPERAGERAAKATEVVVGGLTRPQPSGAGGAPRPVVGDLDEPLRALAGRVPPAQAGRHVADLLGAMGEARQAGDLCNGARGVLTLADRLPPADRERAVARAVQLLLPALDKASSASEFVMIAATLELVDHRSPVRAGDEHARAAMGLVEKTKRGLELPPLAEAYRVVLARLPDGGAAPHAEAFAGYVVQTVGKTRSPLDLVALARALRSVGGFLPPDSKQAEALMSLFFQRWDEAPEEILTEQIGEAIQAVAVLLPAGRAGPAADRVLAALGKAGARDRRVLAEVHEALIRRLPDDQARPRRVAALRACLHAEALGASPGPFRGAVPNPAARPAPPAYLSPLVASCTPGDLIEVLGSPACTGDVQGWLLAELGRRLGREFRSIWDVPPAR